jgi:hypothetical protein
MIRKSANRFSEKIMLKQRDEIIIDEIDRIMISHLLVEHHRRGNASRLSRGKTASRFLGIMR